MAKISSVTQLGLLLGFLLGWPATISAVHSPTSQGGMMPEKSSSSGHNGWLSLLTQGIASLTSNDPKSVQHFERSLVEMAHTQKNQKFVPDEQMQGALDLLDGLLASMKDSIKAGHNTSQEELNTLQANLSSCEAPDSQTFQEAWNRYSFRNSEEEGVDFEEVKSCRKKQWRKFWTWRRCENMYQSWLIRSDEFCAQWLQNQTSLTAEIFQSQCAAKADGVCNETDIQDLINMYEDAKARYNISKDACKNYTDFMKQFEDGVSTNPGDGIAQSFTGAELNSTFETLPYLTNESCPSLWSKLVNQTSTCNSAQEQFELNVCNRTKKEEQSWSNYASCYDPVKTLIDSQESLEFDNTLSRQQEYRAVLRIDCLVQALKQNDTSAALAVCINKTYTLEQDFPFLKMTWPTEQRSFPLRKKCFSQMAFPGTDEFIKAVYQPRQPEQCDLDNYGWSECDNIEESGDAHPWAFYTNGEVPLNLRTLPGYGYPMIKNSSGQVNPTYISGLPQMSSSNDRNCRTDIISRNCPDGNARWWASSTPRFGWPLSSEVKCKCLVPGKSPAIECTKYERQEILGAYSPNGTTNHSCDKRYVCNNSFAFHLNSEYAKGCPSGSDSSCHDKYGDGNGTCQMCEESLGSNGKYKGCQTKTVTGKECLNWQQIGGSALGARLENSAYCRNPDSGGQRETGRIWCYVGLPNTFEYCEPMR
eukprot:TRINITY_DN95659_c0_g1_i1.p1 TRINITY_DN95659_c0_g1~~TRINITY_DN95659_c0_g1_i1.p1  ORF type:complete len:702 (-),score=68.69 TRINITY_DN95659_c0_g1_i1:313-2418(-)